MRMPPRDLRLRTRLFALAVWRFCRRLRKTADAQEAASQLQRAANSTRSNYRAARNGRSRAEFVAKLGEAFEEADEARDWLEYLEDTGIARDPALLQESREIMRILGAALRTARHNSRNPPQPQPRRRSNLPRRQDPAPGPGTGSGTAPPPPSDNPQSRPEPPEPTARGNQQPADSSDDGADTHGE